MGLNHSPTITTSGLILNLDAANPVSYPGTVFPSQVEYLIVAGGGGGGGGQSGGLRSGGGGGGGGVLTGFTNVTPQSYTITVGTGGPGGAADNPGSAGQNSSALGFTAIGGGGGAGISAAASTGGSGGGGSGNSGQETGAAGTTGQGTSGGTGTSVSPFNGGGGGGAGVPGLAAGGGTGIASTITGTSTFYGGGGSGGNSITGGPGGGTGGGGAGGGFLTSGTLLTVNNAEIGFVGGRYIFQIDCPAPNTAPPYTTLAAIAPGTVVTLVRGGGNVSVTVGGVTTLPALNRVTFDPVTGYAGANVTGTQVLVPGGGSSGGSAGTAGTANTGGGGGGAGGQASTAFAGGAGGSGVVVIRYPGTQQATGGTVTSADGFTIHRFTSSGVFAPLTWTDVSGQRNNATLVNAPTYSSSNGGFLIFNGVNQWANLGNTSLSTTALTVIAWVFDSHPTGATYRDIVTKQGQFKFRVDANAEGGNLSAFVYIGGSPEPRLSATWTRNVWTQIAFTWNTNGNFRIFTNGVLRSSSNTRTGTLGTSALALGVASDAGLADFWTGNVSDVLIYNATLTDDEINQNFQALRGRYGI